MITYPSGSNWYLCFSFCIIIYSFVCQFFLHYYRYWYNQKQSSVVFYKKSVLTMFSKFAMKHMCYSLIFNEFAELQILTLSKKRFQDKYFLVNFAKLLKASFSKNPLGGWFYINNCSVYCPTVTFCVSRNDVTHIFWLNIFLA